MSLADHIGGWLEPGDHECQVQKVELTSNPNKGTKGINVYLVRGAKSIKRTFWLTHDAMFWLANFAQDCGLTDAEMQSYDENDLNSHQILVGKRVVVRVGLSKPKADGKRYHEVYDTWPVGDPAPALPQPPTNPAPTLTVDAMNAKADAAALDADIPF